MQSRKLSRFFAPFPALNVSRSFLDPCPGFFPHPVAVLLTRSNSAVNFHELLHWAVSSRGLVGFFSFCLWPVPLLPIRLTVISPRCTDQIFLFFFFFFFLNHMFIVSTVQEMTCIFNDMAKTKPKIKHNNQQKKPT